MKTIIRTIMINDDFLSRSLSLGTVCANRKNRKFIGVAKNILNRIHIKLSVGDKGSKEIYIITSHIEMATPNNENIRLVALLALRV
jgi:hypothetical protein